MLRDMGILDVIRQYDEERERYIEQLERENEKLRAEKAEAIQLAFRGAQIHESSMLKLILSGALRKPDTSPDTTPDTKPRSEP